MIARSLATVCLALSACSPSPRSYTIEVNLPELHRCDYRVQRPSRPSDCAERPCGWHDLEVVAEPSGDGRLNVYTTDIAAGDVSVPPLPSADLDYDRTAEGSIILPSTRISKNVTPAEFDKAVLPAISAAPPTNAGIAQKCVMLDPSQRLTFGEVVRMHKALTRIRVRRTNLAAREAID